MKIHHCKQGSKEWFELRLAKPTASSFNRILQPKKLVMSASANDYASELVAEWFTLENADGASSAFMERGKELEIEALSWYENVKKVKVEKVGFISNDDDTMGCSPDGLVGDDGGLEIKCPAAKKHVEYVCDPTILVADYRLQVQASLWISGREWWDVMSFNPNMQECIERVYPVPKVFEAFERELPTFLEMVEGKKKQLANF